MGRGQRDYIFLGEIGVILLLFDIGLETDLGKLVSSGKSLLSWR